VGPGGMPRQSNSNGLRLQTSVTARIERKGVLGAVTNQHQVEHRLRPVEVRPRRARLGGHRSARRVRAPANGGWRSCVEAAILKGMGVRAGVPDIIAIKDGGRCYALERNASGGRLTPVQRDAYAALTAAGVAVSVAYGLDDALR
jgi:hypothetical protein